MMNPGKSGMDVPVYVMAELIAPNDRVNEVLLAVLDLEEVIYLMLEIQDIMFEKMIEMSPTLSS